MLSDDMLEYLHAMSYENLRPMSEREYAKLLMHRLWEVECEARKDGFAYCAGAVCLARLELMELFPNFNPPHSQKPK